MQIETAGWRPAANRSCAWHTGGILRILFVLAAVVVTVGPATAQPAATIAVEGGVSQWMDVGSEECDECTPLVREFGGEVAILATDSLAVLAGVGLGSFGIGVSADDILLELDSRQLETLINRYKGVDCTQAQPLVRGLWPAGSSVFAAFSLPAGPPGGFCGFPRLAYGPAHSVTVLTVSSGLRYHGPPGRARFFAEVEVGVSRLFSTVELLELRESGSVTGRHITPGVGVDIAVNDRTAVRISGGWDIGRIEGETFQSAGGGAGLVFNVGRR